MISLSFTDQRSRIGSLVLDVLVSEELELRGEVTRYPVEDGTIISDHITEGEITVRISGLVASSDVGLFGFSAARYKAMDAVDALRAMHRARALVTVSTGFMLHSDMGISNLRAIRSNGERAGWLEIEAELTKVRKVRLRTAEVPEAAAQAPARGRAGQTNTPAGTSSGTSSAAAQAPAQPAQPSSVLKGAVGIVGDLFRGR